MIQGKKVILDSIEQDDLEILRQWRNRTEYRKYFREYREIGKDMQKKWYENYVLNDKSTIMFAVRDAQTESLIGCCGLCYINWVNRNADLSLYMGINGVYIDESGQALEACQLLFDYGFGELGLEKIWTEIYEFDEQKYALYKKLGFSEDGRLRRQYFHDNKWWDSYILSLLSEEHRRRV